MILSLVTTLILLASVTIINVASDPVDLGAPDHQMVAMAVTNGTSSSISTPTPIKHLIVIYQENIAFDTYFATYPIAENLPGEPHFSASPENLGRKNESNMV